MNGIYFARFNGGEWDCPDEHVKANGNSSLIIVNNDSTAFIFAEAGKENREGSIDMVLNSSFNIASLIKDKNNFEHDKYVLLKRLSKAFKFIDMLFSLSNKGGKDEIYLQCQILSNIINNYNGTNIHKLKNEGFRAYREYLSSKNP